MSFKFDGEVCSDLYLIKDFVDDVLEKLNKIVDDEKTMFEVKLILNELVANGAIHGNSYDREKSVSLYVEVLKKDLIRIEVTDEGEGFECDFKSYDPLDLKCSGRGLVLVNGLSDEFYVKKNKTIAIKYL